VVNELRKHFRQRQGEGNKKGWPSRHFWYGPTTRSVSQNTALTDVTDSLARISIDDPRFAHKVNGGTIRTKRGKYLALPTRPESYAAGSPREGNITDLFFIRTRGRAYLAKKEGSALRVYYRLVRSVTQPADPRALPDRAVLAAAIDDETTRFAMRILSRGGAA
jgi:hypothetical protein